MSSETAPTLRPDDPEFWKSRYREKNTPWDLDQPAPPFVSFLERHAEKFPPGRMAVLGAGLGHDAAFFGRHGFEVTGFDYACEAVMKAGERYGGDARFQQADIFRLPEETCGTFDYVVEHTCFCAILPKQRPAYVEAAYRLLKPGGKLIGLFWAHQQEGGPPYRTDEDELARLFSHRFVLDSVERPENSVEGRAGQELLCVMTRRE
jgi:SAM-dependent methyltransferase